MVLTTINRSEGNAWPAQIFSNLPIHVRAKLITAAHEQGLQGSTTETKFFIGYLLGYANAAADSDRDHPHLIESTLFISAFGSKNGDCVRELTFDLVERGDEQVCLGERCGSQDGAAFLTRVKNANLFYVTEALHGAIVSGEADLEERFVSA